jgi:hypothetical protein
MRRDVPHIGTRNFPRSSNLPALAELVTGQSEHKTEDR